MRRKLIKSLLPLMLISLLASCQSVAKAENKTGEIQQNEIAENDLEDLGEWKSNEVIITLEVTNSYK